MKEIDKLRHLTGIALKHYAASGDGLKYYSSSDGRVYIREIAAERREHLGSTNPLKGKSSVEVGVEDSSGIWLAAYYEIGGEIQSYDPAGVHTALSLLQAELVLETLSDV